MIRKLLLYEEVVELLIVLLRREFFRLLRVGWKEGLEGIDHVKKEKF